MSSDLQDTISTSSGNISPVQIQADAFNSFMAMPVTKLDADQYLVSDIDGITEGLFGSGNMNFLMMQASQTDESIHTLNPFDIVGGNDGIQTVAPVLSANPFLSAGSSVGPESLSGWAPSDLADIAPQLDGAGSNNNTSTNLGSLGASNYAANSDSAAPFSSIQNFASSSYVSNARTFPPGTNGTNGVDGTSGNNGQNGTNGTDGTGGGGDIINNITNNYTDFLTETVENVTDVVNNITNNTTDIVTTIIDNVFNTINNGQPLGPVGIDIGLTLDNLTNVTLDIISGDQILNVIDEIIDLSPILAPVDDLLGNIAAGVDLSVILNPFQYDASPDDTDLSILTDLGALGLPLLSSLDNLHVPLDPVEGLLGDLDIELDLASDILGDLLGGNADDTDLGLNLGGLGLGDLQLPVLGAENILLNPVEDLLGDIDINLVPAIDLFDTTAIDNAAGDTDIVLPLDVNLLGGDILGDSLSISLDPIEQITGDIDFDLGVAANLLGNTADGLIDDFAGGTGNDTILSELGDVVTDILSPLLPADNNADTDLTIELGGDLPVVDLLDNAGAIILNPVEDLAGDLDIGLAPSLDLFNNADIDNGAGDSDIVVPLDLALVDSPLLSETLELDLDPLEQLTGDIDLDITAAANILGDVAGDLIDDETGGTATPNLLTDAGDFLSSVADPLVTAPNLADPASILPNAEDIFEVIPDATATSLNLVDSITQTLDDTVGTAIDLISSVLESDNLLNTDLLGGAADTGSLLGGSLWTDSVLPDAGDLFGDGLASDLGNLLSDPATISSPIESITPPAIVQDVFDGLGLNSGRHFGGLFG